MRCKPKKIRRCRSCGEKLSIGRLWLCEECEAAGFGIKLRMADIKREAQELYDIAKERENMLMNPLNGMHIDEISLLCTLYSGTQYNSYGKLRAYVHEFRKLPPRR